MNHNQFWDIVDEACQRDPRLAEEWDQRLFDALVKLPADEIIEWNHIFDRLAKTAYFTDMWAAAYHINGGASDDGFYYFRCWLIGMGRDVYGAAVANPDSLADVVSPSWDPEGIDAQAETYAAAHQAWMRVSGEPDTAPYPARDETTELVGEDWNFEDLQLMRQRLPRLWALYENRYES